MDSNRVDVSNLTLEQIRNLAAKNVQADFWQAIGRAAESGNTVQRNLKIFDKIMLKQRVFHGYPDASTSFQLFGSELSSPILVAPMGSFWRVRPSGDREVALGTQAAKSMLFVSQAATRFGDGPMTLEAYIEEPHPPLVWMSYFMYNYEDALASCKKAESLGYTAAGITIDTVESAGGRLRYSATTKDVERIRKEISLPLVVKGIMCEEDAILAVEAGADAVVVSNHGGKVMDFSRSPLEALPEVVRAVGDKSTVLVDGGFRRGTDILKALALGARAVLVGRPIYWGLGAAGADGVSRVLTLLTEELRRNLHLCGVPTVSDVSREILYFERDSPFSLRNS